ncbi:uncharacterized protein [Drosophila tropicalis]|uniref:uncharacterized protein n=1 Tax=Drosophila tropicalis TaxID=46794 RepID=UPI0035ABBFB7
MNQIKDYIIDWTIAIVLSLCFCLILNYMGIKSSNNLLWNRQLLLNDDYYGTSMEESEATDATCYASSPFDVYFNFMLIFVCIFAFSKITELSERYLSDRMLSKQRRHDVRTINEEWEQTMQLYETDKNQMNDELEELRVRNKDLEHMMHELRDCNIQLISQNFMRNVLQDQQQKQQAAANNIYITNRHIHLTRQVFVNEGHIDLSLQDQQQQQDLQRPAGGQENLENLNVWVQYLKMRKCYMGPIADPNLIVNTGSEKNMPIVMTTEQLAKLQGLI